MPIRIIHLKNGDDCTASRHMQLDDLKRQAKVVDMMLTMHSVLTSRYQIGVQASDLTLLAYSTVILALTFIDPLVSES
jgi:hypothetical protein